MSKMTVCIKRINEHLERISGLDGIATELLEIEERRISEIVDIIEKHFSDANIFNYYGESNPEKYGEWIRSGGNKYPDYTCSECSYDSNMEMPYCANCGAKMDGGN